MGSISELIPDPAVLLELDLKIPNHQKGTPGRHECSGRAEAVVDEAKA